MKLVKYFYYKIFKTFKRIDRIVNLYYPPHYHAINIVSLFLFSIPLWITIKLKWWHSELYWQYILAVAMCFIFFGIHVFTEKIIKPGSITMFENESFSSGLKGAIITNSLLIFYTLLWAYTLLK